MNLTGPSSRISAFWQDSAGVKEVWGQTEGSTVRQTSPTNQNRPIPHLYFLLPKGPVVFLTKKKGCPKDKGGGHYNYIVRSQPEIYTGYL